MTRELALIRHDLIQQHARSTPDRIAICDATREISWLDFADMVAHAAGALAHIFADTNVPRRIAFLADSTIDVVVLQSAAATLGVACVGIDHSLSAVQIAGCIDQARPGIVAATPRLHRRADDALALSAHRPMCLYISDGVPDAPGWTSWAKLTADGSWPPADGWERPTFEALGFTSGTSGQPKLVVRHESFEARRHRDVVAMFDVTADDIYLNTVPLFHASSAGWARIFLTEGARVVLGGDDGPQALAQLSNRTGATFTLMVPPTLAAFTEAVSTDGDRPPLRAVVTGGRHVSPRLVRQVTAAFGEVLHVYYGTTETGLNTIAAPADLREAPTTAGRPFPGGDVAIVDADGRRVPVREAGFVALSSYMLASSYGDGSAPTISLDGTPYWVTADTGRLDDAGRLFVLGREIGGGMHDVVAAEAAVLDVPAVRDVAIQVVGEHDRTALVVYVATDSAPAWIADAVGDAARAALPQLHVRCVAVDRIPYSPTGKVRRAAIGALPGVLPSEDDQTRR